MAASTLLEISFAGPLRLLCSTLPRQRKALLMVESCHVAWATGALSSVCFASNNCPSARGTKPELFVSLHHHALSAQLAPSASNSNHKKKLSSPALCVGPNLPDLVGTRSSVATAAKVSNHVWPSPHHSQPIFQNLLQSLLDCSTQHPPDGMNQPGIERVNEVRIGVSKTDASGTSSFSTSKTPSRLFVSGSTHGLGLYSGNTNLRFGRAAATIALLESSTRSLKASNLLPDTQALTFVVRIVQTHVHNFGKTTSLQCFCFPLWHTCSEICELLSKWNWQRR